MRVSDWASPHAKLNKLILCIASYTVAIDSYTQWTLIIPDACS